MIVEFSKITVESLGFMWPFLIKLDLYYKIKLYVGTNPIVKQPGGHLATHGGISKHGLDTMLCTSSGRCALR